MIIKQVYLHSKDKNQKLVTIPKDSNINPGDYVIIKKIEEKDNE